MRKATLILALVLATVWAVPVSAQAHAFSCGLGFGFPCYGPPGFFLSGTHLGLGPGYPGLAPVWSPFGWCGNYPGDFWPPYWTPPVTVVVVRLPRYAVEAATSNPGNHQAPLAQTEPGKRWEKPRGSESTRSVPELDIDLEHLSGTGGYTARLYYDGKFYSASATTNRKILSSAITVWQHTD